MCAQIKEIKMKKNKKTINVLIAALLLCCSGTFVKASQDDNIEVMHVATKKIEALPKDFLNIQFETTRLLIRPLQAIDFKSEDIIQQLYGYDSSDPMDAGNKDEQLPSINELQSTFEDLYAGEVLPALVLGIFDKNQKVCVGRISILPGSYFYHAIEITTRMNPNARSKGYCSEARIQLNFELEKIIKDNKYQDILFLEGAINKDNFASLRVANKAGMIKFVDDHSNDSTSTDNLFYKPIISGSLQKPVLIPSVESKDTSKK